MENNRNIYLEYASIKQQIATLEEQRKELEIMVLDDLDTVGGHADTEYGLFKSSGRKVWDYSPLIKAKSEELSSLKKQEELTGKATLRKVTSFVTFTPIKEVKNNDK